MDWRRLHRPEVYAVAAAAVGAIFFLASGRVEGVFNVRILLVPVLALSLVPTIYIGLSYAVPLKRAPTPRDRTILLLGLIAGYGLVGLGQQRDGNRIIESFNRGDVLIAAIEAYRRDTGSYPYDLSALEARGIVVPEPALDNSVFWYRSYETDNFALSFPSVSGRLCTRRARQGNWTCES